MKIHFIFLDKLGLAPFGQVVLDSSAQTKMCLKDFSACAWLIGVLGCNFPLPAARCPPIDNDPPEADARSSPGSRRFIIIANTLHPSIH